MEESARARSSASESVSTSASDSESEAEEGEVGRGSFFDLPLPLLPPGEGDLSVRSITELSLGVGTELGVGLEGDDRSEGAVGVK